MNIRFYALSMALLLMSVITKAQVTPASQMEKLNRGLVVVKFRGITDEHMVSWRQMGWDDPNTTYDVYVNGSRVRSDLNVTNYKVRCEDGAIVKVVAKANGKIVDTAETTAWNSYCLPIVLDRPNTGANGGTYSPNDCSVGDVDGDGEYEIILKWDPSTSQDNSNHGITDNVFLDCYKLNGTKLWRIDLGVNIRAGAHYTQFMVYDFDGDGKAEMMCKTAPGSIDGAGNYVSQAATLQTIKNTDDSKDWRTSNGRINGGHEYLTVFDGMTGEAVHTVPYWPNRNALAELSEAAGTFNWDDRSGKTDKGDYGNRGERYLACVAYLDGPDSNPSAVFCRGYYTYAYAWAVGFDGTHLTTKWLHRSDSKTKTQVVNADGNVVSEETYSSNTSGIGDSYTLYANGNHNLSVADVDGDGKDEIIWSQSALDDNGELLYCVGYGHGDAMHLSKLMPDREGLQVFAVHEEAPYGWDIHDARTGEVLYSGTAGNDTGRGLAADIVDSRGFEFWTSNAITNPASCVTGEQVATATDLSSKGCNFRIYWDADYNDELLDGGSLVNFNQSTGGRSGINYDSKQMSSCNGTKATPCLTADIFGDWREELILWDPSDYSLKIYSTVTATNFKVPTLMHDHIYRMGIAWQNVGYNQPPHLGYYLPDYINKEGDFVGPSSILFSENNTNDMFIAGHYDEVTVSRTLKANTWNTFCVPFAMSKEQITSNFGDDAEVKALSGVEVNGDDVLMSFSTSETVEAGVPYMVRVKNAVSEIRVENAVVALGDMKKEVTATDGTVLTFFGNYGKQLAPRGSYIISNNVFYLVDSDVNLKGFRGYFVVDNPASQQAKTLSFVFDDATSINGISDIVKDNKAYNILGQRVDKNTTGFIIINGKKYVNR